MELDPAVCRTMARPGGLGKRGAGTPPGGQSGLALGERQCYIVTRSLQPDPPPTAAMPTHVHPQHHHHHHPAGQGHPPAAVSPSILRMSILERLAIAAVLIAVLWGAVAWAMMG